MTIEVINRGFVMAIPNAAEDQYLHIRCSENQMSEIARFVRFADLGFKQARGKGNYISNPHKVTSHSGVVEAPNGKVFFEIIDEVVHFKPLNEIIPGLEFKVPLETLAQTLAKETNLGRWDDYRVGEVTHDGRVVHLYTHTLLDNVITVTDRETFYMTLHYEDSHWRRGDSYITNEMWYRIAEACRTSPDWLPAHDIPLAGMVYKIMHDNDFNTVADVKKHFNQL